MQLLLSIGSRFAAIFAHIGALSWLLLDASTWIFRSLGDRKVRLGRAAIVGQVCRIGVSSILIVSLVSGSIGFILAFQMAPPLDNLGQVELVPNIIAVAVLRELGPLIAAIVLVGFAGAAIAAEIGTMVVGEEIEALEAHALNPVRFLVVPRIIAAVISLGCLAVLSDLMAVLSAAFMSKTVLGIGWTTYYKNTLAEVYGKEVVHPANLYQLYAYIRNLDLLCPGKRVGGMLLYPTVQRELDLTYTIHGYAIHVRTVNLMQPWQKIADRLQSLAPLPVLV